jgi:hypothetical protein
MIQQAIDWTSAQKSVATSYGLDLIAYEGGPSLVNSNDPALTTLYIAANRDSRMGTAVTTYLTKWQQAGGNFFNFYSDITPYTKGVLGAHWKMS